MRDNLDETSDRLSEFASDLAHETLRLLQAEADSNDIEGLDRALILSYLANFLTEALERTLTTPPGVKGQAAYDHVSKAFSELKFGTQNAVASAFSTALAKFSGQEVEYMCVIKPAPQPESKLTH